MAEDEQHSLQGTQALNWPLLQVDSNNLQVLTLQQNTSFTTGFFNSNTTLTTIASTDQTKSEKEEFLHFKQLPPQSGMW